MEKQSLIVCGVKEAEKILKERDDIFSVVSIASGTHAWGGKETRPFHLKKAKRVLRLFFDDCFSQRDADRFGMEVVQESDIKRLIAFARLIKFGTPEQEGTCIVHCQAGISRSSACAFVMCCWAMGEGNECAAINKVFSSGVGQVMEPNELIIAIGDNLLKRNGAMRRAF